MENLINKIITTQNGNKYMVIDQGNYDGKAYYFTSQLDQDGNLTENYSIYENNNDSLNLVEDRVLLKALINYFKNRNK